MARRFRERHHNAALERVEHLQGRRGTPSCLGADPFVVALEGFVEFPRRGHRPLRSDPHSFKEEGQPSLPVAGLADVVQEPVVLGAVLFQEEAQVEKGVPQHTGVNEQERDRRRPTRPLPSRKG